MEIHMSKKITKEDLIKENQRLSSEVDRKAQEVRDGIAHENKMKEYLGNFIKEKKI